jgi:hypothetical protein
MERSAEIQAAMDNTSQCSPETAQVRVWGRGVGQGRAVGRRRSVDGKGW